MSDYQSQPPTQPSVQDKSDKGPSIQRIAIIAGIVLVVAIVLLFILALVLTLIDVERAAATLQVLRDFFIIVMALQSILIAIALVVLILQVARLINLLQNEVKPILENTQETVKTAKGTVQFVGTNLTEPIVKTSAFLAGMGVVVREIGGIRKAIAHSEESENGKH